MKNPTAPPSTHRPPAEAPAGRSACGVHRLAGTSSAPASTTVRDPEWPGGAALPTGEHGRKKCPAGGGWRWPFRAPRCSQPAPPRSGSHHPPTDRELPVQCFGWRQRWLPQPHRSIGEHAHDRRASSAADVHVGDDPVTLRMSGMFARSGRDARLDAWLPDRRTRGRLRLPGGLVRSLDASVYLETRASAVECYGTRLALRRSMTSSPRCGLSPGFSARPPRTSASP